MNYLRVVDEILPHKTKWRHFYNIVARSIRIILNSGFSGFLFIIKERMRETSIGITNIPIIETKTTPTSSLSLMNCLAGRFTFLTKNLNEIRIFTKKKSQNSDLIFQITSVDGQIIRKIKVRGNLIKDNEYTSFKFEPIQNSKGETFFFKLISEKFPSAEVMYNDSITLTELHLFYRDIPINGAINFQALSNENITQYDIWILKNEPTCSDLKKQKEDSLQFDYRPLISVLTPVYNPPPGILEAAIESVIEQTYDNWEMCLVDGGSEDTEIRGILNKFSRKDPRIKVTFLKENMGISGNSNIALSSAKGEYIALLDHDDLLAPFAFFEMAKVLNEKPSLDFLYSDRDLVKENGKRFNPLFKPDWSPEIMLSVNYLTHLCLIRKSLVDRIGGFLSETDGAQDWDLFLRIIEKTQKIQHVPKVLYHWRVLDTSCSIRGDEAKPYIVEAQHVTLKNHLQRQGLFADVIFVPPGLWRIKWLVTNQYKVSIIIPTKDNFKFLRPCIESILTKSTYHNFEIIIIDTGSKEETSLEYYHKLNLNPIIRIVNYNKPFNYSAVNNLGAQHATGDIMLFLNDDTEVITSDWIEEMIGWIQRKEIGVVGAKLLKPDRSIQHAGVIMGMHGFANHVFAGTYENYTGPFGSTEWYRDYLAVTAACIMIRRELFEEVGGFNEAFTLMGSDVELCLRIHGKGYRVVYTPFAKLKHHEAATRGNYIPPHDFLESYKHYVSFLRNGDPYYNTNLSLWSTIPRIKNPDEKVAIEYAQEILNNAAK